MSWVIATPGAAQGWRIRVMGDNMGGMTKQDRLDRLPGVTDQDELGKAKAGLLVRFY